MTDITQQTMQPGEAQMGDYYALMKPRVMQLVVFTALVGLLAAPVAVHPYIAFVGILCIAVGAGASGALNMWWDADIDAMMRRTQSRPVPAGRVQPREALGIGLALSGFSVISRSSFTRSSTRCGSSGRRRRTSSSAGPRGPSRRWWAGPWRRAVSRPRAC
jgi:heme O synthase-like polyprenyltransferase